MVSPIIVTNANQRKIKLLKSGEVEAKEKDILSITAQKEYVWIILQILKDQLNITERS